MVRILNFFCVALMGLSILALYHVSEKTRVAHMQLNQVNAPDRPGTRRHRRAGNRMAARRLARTHPAAGGVAAGHGDSASVQLSSFDQLPRRGADPAPLNNTPVHNASAEVPAAPAAPPAPDSGM